MRARAWTRSMNNKNEKRQEDDRASESDTERERERERGGSEHTIASETVICSLPSFRTQYVVHITIIRRRWLRRLPCLLNTHTLKCNLWVASRCCYLFSLVIFIFLSVLFFAPGSMGSVRRSQTQPIYSYGATVHHLRDAQNKESIQKCPRTHTGSFWWGARARAFSLTSNFITESHWVDRPRHYG